MHRRELIGNRKGFFIKVLFFLTLLTFSILMYLESHMIMDAIYFGIVLVLFIKFLRVKLYQ